MIQAYKKRGKKIQADYRFWLKRYRLTYKPVSFWVGDVMSLYHDGGNYIPLILTLPDCQVCHAKNQTWRV